MNIIIWMNKILKIAIMILISTILTAFLAGIIINVHVVNYSKQFIASDIDGIKAMAGSESETVIVPGAYVYENGQPCPMLADRLLAGISVYEAGLAGTMLLTGDHGTRGYDEVNAMKEYAFSKSIPADDVFLDHAGFSTYDSIIRARKIFEVDSAVISTQNYHLSRAVYIARHSGIEAYGISSDLRRYPRSEMARYELREWLARIKDFMYIRILKPKPVFLGEKIPITGSSAPSYDKPVDLE